MNFCTHCGQPTRPENGGNSAKQLEQQPDAQFCPEYEAPARLPITRFLPDEPEYIGFGTRAVAGLIDAAVIGVIWATMEISPVALPKGLIVYIAYPVYYVALTGLRGQTLGKMALGIMVVNERGDPPGILRAAFREIVGKFVSYIVMYHGYFSIIWDEKKRGWHDRIAKTYVIRAPGRRGRPAPEPSTSRSSQR